MISPEAAPRTRVVLASASGPRLAEARAWLLADTKSEVLIIGASKRAADDFARTLCPIGGGLAGLYRTTLRHLAAELAMPALAEVSRAIVSPLGAEALVARAIHRVLVEGGLEYFAPVARTPGFARALASTLSELRNERVDPARLEASDARGRDLARLQRAYEEELDRGHLADTARVLELAIGRAPRMPPRALLALDAAPTSALEIELLGALSERAPRVLATLSIHDTRGHAALEAALGSGTTEILEPARGRGLRDAQAQVFARGDARPGTSTRAPSTGAAIPELDPEVASRLEAAYPEGLELFSAPGEGRECVEIARRVLKAAALGVPFDQMAVLLRNPETYQPLVEDALARADAPAFYTRGVKRPDPAGRALLALLACRTEGLSAMRFAEYLSLGQVPDVEATGAPRAREVAWVAPKNEAQLVFRSLEVTPLEEEAEAPASPPPTDTSPVVHGTLRAPVGWEALLVEASVVLGGPERWRRRLEGLRAELELRRRAADTLGEAGTHHIDRDLERLGHLERFALPVITRLFALPAEATWGRWLDELRDLAGLALKAPRGVAEVLAELEPMRDVGPVSLEEVVAVLSERLTLLRTESVDRRFGRVFVGTIEEAAGRSFEIVFLPGLAEGIFPRKAFEDPLLLDGDRRALSPRLQVREDRSHDERLRFALALGAAERVLFASYPRMEAAEGKPRVPSFYALDLLRAAEGRLPEVRALEARASSAASARLGWPAPTRPEDAIDDAEFDLAMLEPLIARGSEPETKGRARYLLLVNPHLSRALRVRAARTRRAWKTGDGLVEADALTKRILERHALTARAYAATDLERFAVCPYQFLLKAIHRLRVREEPVRLEELDPATRGSLFHEVLFFAFGELTRLGLWPMRAEAFAETAEALDRVLDTVKRDYAERLVPAIPRVFDREIEEIRKDLYGWIHAVTTRDAEWAPAHAELGFGDSRHRGQETRDPASVDRPVRLFGRYDVKGRIDLVERHRAFGWLRVTDYKTGRIPKTPPEVLGFGEYLQPMIYALAVESLLGGSVSQGSLFFSTTKSNFARVEIGVTDEARARVEEALDIIATSVADGFFPAAPREKACDICDFRAACGDDVEPRASRKDAAPLVALTRLRSIR